MSPETTQEVLKLFIDKPRTTGWVARQCNTWGLPALNICSHLMTRGLLRHTESRLPPTISSPEGEMHPDAFQYELTEFGRTWLTEAAHSDAAGGEGK